MRPLQIIIPFIIAGIGTCFTGVILDHVQYWEVYIQVDELIIILPALLGLKGNLQMTMASRLSTHSHLGHLSNTSDLLNLTSANLSLNQCLSIIISLNASWLAIIIHLFTSDDAFDGLHALLIVATALITSSVVSFILDLLMILIVQVSSLYGVNPDNIATPLAASLGDMTALLTCTFVSSNMYTFIKTPTFVIMATTVIIFYILTIPFWAYITQDNMHTYGILLRGSYWYPLITAMVISCISGVILKTFIVQVSELALFHPVFCGTGGNLVGVQASRLSTLLHREQQIGTLPEDESVCMNPCKMILSNKRQYHITRLLMLMVLPGQAIFYLLCIYMNSRTEVSVQFLMLYLLAAEILVIILLYLAHVLTYGLWVLGIDPDNCTLPYLSSVGDVLGAIFVTIVCSIAAPKAAMKLE